MSDRPIHYCAVGHHSHNNLVFRAAPCTSLAYLPLANRSSLNPTFPFLCAVILLHIG
jgi:hypothetical protein